MPENWKRGEFKNLKRTFPGLKWRMESGNYRTEAVGRGLKVTVYAFWVGPSLAVGRDELDPARFVVSVFATAGERMVQASSVRPWDAIRSAKRQLTALASDVWLAVSKALTALASDVWLGVSKAPPEVTYEAVAVESTRFHGMLTLRSYSSSKGRLAGTPVIEATHRAMVAAGIEAGDAVVFTVRKKR